MEYRRTERREGERMSAVITKEEVVDKIRKGYDVTILSMEPDGRLEVGTKETFQSEMNGLIDSTKWFLEVPYLIKHRPGEWVQDIETEEQWNLIFVGDTKLSVIQRFAEIGKKYGLSDIDIIPEGNYLIMVFRKEKVKE